MSAVSPRGLIADEPDLALCRYWVDDHLTQYCTAMDTGNGDAAGRLLSNADLYFKDHPLRRGYREISDFYAAAFATGDATAHLIGNLSVGIEQERLFYNCRYQRWSLQTPTAPVCTGIGTYSGRFDRIPGGVVWLEHHVITFS